MVAWLRNIYINIHGFLAGRERLILNIFIYIYINAMGLAGQKHTRLLG